MNQRGGSRREEGIKRGKGEERKEEREKGGGRGEFTADRSKVSKRKHRRARQIFHYNSTIRIGLVQSNSRFMYKEGDHGRPMWLSW